jgi:nitrite reductase (NADH) large subunit
MTRYVIVGGGVAGTTAADTIRQRDEEGFITILTDEPYPLWSKIRLPELFSGSIAPKDLIIRKPNWYERQDIDLRTEEEVLSVDTETRTVTTSKGAVVPYDRLLLATGGKAFVPPIPGTDLDNVFTIRKLREAVEVYDRLKDLKRILIIGGGTLGLEVARNLIDLGAEVQVVESHSRLLPTLTDPAASEMLHLRLDHLGINVHHDCQTQSIQGNGKAEWLVLEDGRRLKCDAVIIATGMRAEKSLAEAIGLEMERGIVVDDHLETSIPGIFAAGDACEHKGVKYGIWRAAENQGTIAGANMAGGEVAYYGTVLSKYVRVADADVFSAGNLDNEGKLESIVHVDMDSMIYKKLVIDDCRVVGAVMVGDLRDAQRALRAIETGAYICPHMDMLRTWDMSFVSKVRVER